MSQFSDVMTYLREKRERAINGLYNCIPFPFTRFRELYPGTQMGKYIICTANQKVKESNLLILLYF